MFLDARKKSHHDDGNNDKWNAAFNSETGFMGYVRGYIKLPVRGKNGRSDGTSYNILYNTTRNIVLYKIPRKTIKLLAAFLSVF